MKAPRHKSPARSGMVARPPDGGLQSEPSPRTPMTTHTPQQPASYKTGLFHLQTKLRVLSKNMNFTSRPGRTRFPERAKRYTATQT